MFHWFLELLESKIERSPNHITFKVVQKAFCDVKHHLMFYFVFNSHLFLS